MASVKAVRALAIEDPALEWIPLADCARLPDAEWLHWLQDPGSLTARLKRLAGQKFSVEVQAEGWIVLTDPALLRQFGPLASAQRFWSRQVQLRGNGQAWVLAHTLIPEYSLNGSLQKVFSLADQPLGEFLFSQAHLRRGSLDITPFAERAWARRSVFYIQGQAVMVAEAFLPALLTAASDTRTAQA